MPSAPSFLSNVSRVAGKEFRDAARGRWLLLYTLAFVVLGLGVSYVSAASAGGGGFSGFGRTTAGLINLVLLVVPLMALTLGAGSIASERERGTLAYLLAQPVSRAEVLLGKYLGLAGALVAAITLGFGVCAGALALMSSTADPGAFIRLAALSLVLALAMLSVGLLLSAASRRAGVAIGVAIFLGLTLVFLSDLGLMAGTVALRLPVSRLFHLSLLNPLQTFKMWSLGTDTAALDVLGPAGLFALDTYGSSLRWLFAASLAAWVVLPLALAAWVFSRRSPL
jgi:Cu-processing system permease protein